MRAVRAAALPVAAAVAATLVLAGSAAAAQPTDPGATVTPYEECVDTPTGYSCTTGRITVRLTTTPSGARSGTTIDNGRFEVDDGETGCTTTGSYQFAEVFAVAPEESQHLVLRSSARSTGRTRCADRTLDSQCLAQSTVFVIVLPGEVRATSRIRVNCDSPA